MRILLGLTGSVATVLYVKLVEELQLLGIVDVILTERAHHFVDMPLLCDAVEKKGGVIYTDKDEWHWTHNQISERKWLKNDKVLHIELRDRSSAFVIAPCSANTLGKITNGICDNLLTSVARAWDKNRPMVLAPAMNTHMWEHPITKKQLELFNSFSRNNFWISPQDKMLACNTKGVGALAEISTIVKVTQELMRWDFPLHEAWDSEPRCTGIPQHGHPGAFLTKRKHHTHTGVDLYTNDGQAVFAVEDGVVVGIENFTGVSQNTPWWEDTKCILIEGKTGVICYGEIEPYMGIEVGDQIRRGTLVAHVKRVLKPDKVRPDIDGHRTSMLHVEIYKHGIVRAFEEMGENLSDWDDLIDPTPFIMDARHRPEKMLKP